MIGKLEEIDKEELKNKGADRLRIKCRKHEVVDCSIKFFLGDIGHFISFEGEDRKEGGDEDPSDQYPGKSRDKDKEVR
jgi:hypothetical protein